VPFYERIRLWRNPYRAICYDTIWRQLGDRVQSEVPGVRDDKDRVIARLLFQGAPKMCDQCFGNRRPPMADRPRVSKSFARYSEGAPTMPRRCQDCTMFRKPHRCTLVRGAISPTAPAAFGRRDDDDQFKTDALERQLQSNRIANYWLDAMHYVLYGIPAPLVGVVDRGRIVHIRRSTSPGCGLRE